MRPKKTTRPNVLWIMSDQHHAACWSKGGRPEVKTPALSRLADRGTTFTRAYCNNPICGPSRVCFLTGQHVSHHQVSGNNILNCTVEAQRNLGKVFRDAGYQTALIGKAHLPRLWVEEGFEHRRYCDLADADADNPRSCHYFDHLVRSGLGDAYDQGKLTPDRPGSRMEAFVSEIPLTHSLEVWTGNEMVSFLENREKDRPFFAQMSFQRPHDPYAPSPERANSYDPARLSVPANADDYLLRRLAGKPAFQQDHAQGEPGSGYPYRPQNEEDLKKQLSHYYALISMIDEQIGRVMNCLEASGELDNTIIVYHADHGDLAGEHGMMLKNMGIYEAIHRIPFILSYPGGPKGKVEERMIASVDLFSTLCVLAGLEEPAGGDGQVIVGENAAFRNHVVCEWDFVGEPQEKVFAVRDQEYRLVYYPQRPDDGELYHCKRDPGEEHNLYSDPKETATRLRLLMLIFNQISNYRRRHGIGHLRVETESLTYKLHREGRRWSELSRSENL